MLSDAIMHHHATHIVEFESLSSLSLYHLKWKLVVFRTDLSSTAIACKEMASLPANFVFGSTSSAQNVRDAIASCEYNSYSTRTSKYHWYYLSDRRAQYFVAESTVVRATELDDEDYDESVCSLNEQNDAVSNAGGHTAVGDGFVDQLEWDEEGHSDTYEPSRTLAMPQIVLPSSRERGSLNGLAHEATPLLRNAVSFYMAPHPRRKFTSSPNLKSPTSTLPEQASLLTRPNLTRRRSSTSLSQSGKHIYRGQSTFGQTVCMSFPLRSEHIFKCLLTALQLHCNPAWCWHVVWASSFCLLGLDHWGDTYRVLWFYFLLYVCLQVPSYTFWYFISSSAKILARIILADPHLRSYADIGKKAFGPASTPFISGMFCLELFSVRWGHYISIEFSSVINYQQCGSRHLICRFVAHHISSLLYDHL